jgi:hypothetical protein
VARISNQYFQSLSAGQDLLWWGLYKAEPFLLGTGLRKKALAEAMRHVHYEVRHHPCTTFPATGELR